MFTPAQYRRLAVVMLCLTAGLAWLGWRLFEIQVVEYPRLRHKARQYAETTRVLEAWRGGIMDRNRRVLVNSIPVKTVYADLTLSSNRVEQVAQTCGPLLRLPPAEVAARLRRGLQASGPLNSGRKSIVLKRDVPIAEWQAAASALAFESFIQPRSAAPVGKTELWNLRHRLLFARDAQRRCYPYGEASAQVVGFVGVASNRCGLEGRGGLEQAFNKVLAGENGLRVSEQDAAGNEIPFRRAYDRPAEPGANLVLTIDLRVQRILEGILAAARTNAHARGASGIAMDPRTFEILAVAGSPAFNPQSPGQARPETWHNPAFSDRVEPGSTFKMLTLAAALDLGLTSLDKGIYCERGRFVYNHVVVRDHAPYGLLSVREAFAKSSNIAFAKIALELGPHRLYRCITNFGFGRCTGVPTIGETSGGIGPPGNWDVMFLTRAAFGQGVSVSQLQMAVATCVVANQGRLMRPMLVRRVESPQGALLREYQPQFIRAVIRPETARQVKEAMQAVVGPGGTGARAALAGYTAAMKTGTAQKSDQKGYLPGRYYSSMIGFFPADSPRVVLALALDEPENGYYAGTVVAPAFRALAEQIAACLAIPPDKPSRVPGRNAPAPPISTPTHPFQFVAVGSSPTPAGGTGIGR